MRKESRKIIQARIDVLNYEIKDIEEYREAIKEISQECKRVT